MIRLILVIFYFSFFASCNANKNERKDIINTSTDKAQSVSVDTRIQQLKDAFDQQDYPTFLKLFPNSFDELDNYYGFDDNTGAKPLYEFHEKHINYLFEYEGSSEKIFFDKVYGIAKSGKWDADAVGLFQSNLSNLIIKSPKNILEVLSKMPDKEVKSFWFFVFDGSSENDLQNKAKFESIYKKINSLNYKQGNLLKEEYKEMYK